MSYAETIMSFKGCLVFFKFISLCITLRCNQHSLGFVGGGGGGGEVEHI